MLGWLLNMFTCVFGKCCHSLLLCDCQTQKYLPFMQYYCSTVYEIFNFTNFYKSPLYKLSLSIFCFPSISSLSVFLLYFLPSFCLSVCLFIFSIILSVSFSYTRYTWGLCVAPECYALVFDLRIKCPQNFRPLQGRLVFLYFIAPKPFFFSGLEVILNFLAKVRYY